jgi:hypothetical protein
MAETATLVLDEEVLHAVLAMKSAERRAVLHIFHRLREAWWDEIPEFTLRDSTDRILNVKAARPFLITWWHDGAVNELRIVALEKVRY